jgi:hypothetical protein
MAVVLVLALVLLLLCGKKLPGLWYALKLGADEFQGAVRDLANDLAAFLQSCGVSAREYLLWRTVAWIIAAVALAAIACQLSR